MYIDGVRNAQRVLRAWAGYQGALDGVPNLESLAAARRVHFAPGADWPPARVVIGAAQVILQEYGFEAGAPDGFYGPQTDAAFEAWRGATALPDRSVESQWPRQADIARRFGPAAGPACTAGRIVPPWHMVLAWDVKTRVAGIACHADIAASGQRIFDKVAAIYSAAEIRDLGLHLYGGCFNNRPKRGGNSLSMHAWGIAIDFDPARNRLTWGRDQARLARADALPFWDAWEAEGWVSLGRARNFDWMHVQAAAL